MRCVSSDFNGDSVCSAAIFIAPVHSVRDSLALVLRFVGLSLLDKLSSSLRSTHFMRAQGSRGTAARRNEPFTLGDW
jgi:hypothetical protein